MNEQMKLIARRCDALKRVLANVDEALQELPKTLEVQAALYQLDFVDDHLEQARKKVSMALQVMEAAFEKEERKQPALWF